MRSVLRGPAGRALMMNSRAVQYWQKIKALFGSALIAYWPLWDASGVSAADVANGNNGTYRDSGVTLGQAGIGDGKTSALFNSGFCDVYSAGLAGLFNGAEGSAMIWAKVANAGVWTDNADREIVRIAAGPVNEIRIIKQANQNLFLRYQAGGVPCDRSVTAPAYLGWIHCAVTWSKTANETKAFVNGQQVGTTQTVGNWAGSLAATLCTIGAYITGSNPSGYFAGYEAHCLILNRAATPTEVATVAGSFFLGPGGVTLESGGFLLLETGDVLLQEA